MVKRSKPVRSTKAALTRLGSVLRGTKAPLRTPLMATPLQDSSRCATALWSETRGRSAPRLQADCRFEVLPPGNLKAYTFTSIAFPLFTTAPDFLSSSRKPFFSSTRADARFSGNTSPMMRSSASSRKATPQICRTASVPMPVTRMVSESYSQSTRHCAHRPTSPRKCCRQSARPPLWTARHPPSRHSLLPSQANNRHPPQYMDTAAGPTGRSCPRRCTAPSAPACLMCSRYEG